MVRKMKVSERYRNKAVRYYSILLCPIPLKSVLRFNSIFYVLFDSILCSMFCSIRLCSALRCSLFVRSHRTCIVLAASLPTSIDRRLAFFSSPAECVEAPIWPPALVCSFECDKTESFIRVRSREVVRWFGVWFGVCFGVWFGHCLPRSRVVEECP